MKKSIFHVLFLLLAVIGAHAQNIITVHGTVISKADDEPLIGASVRSDIATANGATTDFDGQFTINP